ncbi:MAG: 4-alpha-glucanotransferase, partial [Actinomycetota bacterium]
MGAKAPGARHIRGLSELARLHGVQSAYKDAFGQRRVASAESVLAALSALGAPLERGLDVGPALKERRQELWSRLAEPVIVAWQGRPAEAELRLPADRSEGKVTCRLELEDGEARSWSSNLSQALISTRAEVGGRNFLSRRLALPGGLPLGYHRLTVEAAGRSCSPLLISAPRRAWWGPPGVEGRIWGVFMPLYALRSKDDWGVGDFGDLESLLAWVGELGGSVVGTLPLLAAFLDEPYDESPYAPASRLFWNDLFVDLTAAPELGSSPEAASLLSSTGVAAEIEALRMKELVDYRRVAALKRRVGELLAEALHTSPARASGRYEAFRRFVDSSPGVARYARFRAECELRRSAWQAWPSPEREGVLSEREGVEERRRYHLYVQWLAHEQLDHLSARAPGPGGGLYLDLPVGVHQASYDTWAERDAFV